MLPLTTPATGMDSNRPPERGGSLGYWREVIMELMRERNLSERNVENCKRWKLDTRNPLKVNKPSKRRRKGTRKRRRRRRRRSWRRLSC
jgi:hypothetical protein